MKATTAPALITLFLFFISLSCAPPALESPPASATAAAPGVSSKQPWQSEWERLEAAARKEGKLSIYGEQGVAVANAIKTVFRSQYGIDVEFMTGRTAEVVEKLLAERRAGIYGVDIYMSGTPSAMEVLKPQGVLDPLEVALLLPEVLQPEVWWEGKIPWVDRDRRQIAFLAYTKEPLVVNTDLVKPEEIKSYRDLLQPRWKGQIVMNDPTTGGSGNAWFSAIADGIINLDYLRELARQEPVIIRDQRLQAEWIARGKYPVSIAMLEEMITEFMRLGAPIKTVIPAEGTYVTQGTGALCLVNGAPHPNAAKLFVNWLLGRDGNYTVAKAHGNQSARVDVPTDYLDPRVLRQPGVKYFNTMGEEHARVKREYLKTARDIFGHLIK